MFSIIVVYSRINPLLLANRVELKAARKCRELQSLFITITITSQSVCPFGVSGHTDGDILTENLTFYLTCLD